MEMKCLIKLMLHWVMAKWILVLLLRIRRYQLAEMMILSRVLIRRVDPEMMMMSPILKDGIFFNFIYGFKLQLRCCCRDSVIYGFYFFGANLFLHDYFFQEN